MSIPKLSRAEWRANCRPCLITAQRAYRAAKIIRARGFHAEAGQFCHRCVEAVIEAAIADRGEAILDNLKNPHGQRRDKFRRLWLGSGSPLTKEEQEELTTILSLMALRGSSMDRDTVTYVDYARATPPTIEPTISAAMIRMARRFYRIVRPQLTSIP